MNKISAAIITFNEERNIGRCIRSLEGLVDEIVVVDSYSTDRTKEICLELGAVFFENPFKGHIQQKNFAVSKTSFDYVLSLDADEEVSPVLKASLLKARQSLDKDAYSMNRLTSYCGKWIHHCGWYPDKKIRLFNKNKAVWGGDNPHDKIILDEGAEKQHLTGDLLHYSYESIGSHLLQIEKFSGIASIEAFRKGKKIIPLFHLHFYPVFIFIKKYIFQRGFLDGYYGFVLCRLSAYFKFLQYLKLNELHRSARSDSKQ